MKNEKLGINWFPENVAKIQHTGETSYCLDPKPHQLNNNST
jgi:hypothetical protein